MRDTRPVEPTAQDLAALWRRIQSRLNNTPALAKPLKLLDRHRLTDQQVWELWRDGFDVSAELERRML